MKSGLVLSLAAPPRGKTAGEVIDDGTITTNIKSKLLVEKEISSAISAATFEGEVTLTGDVDNAAPKKKVEEIADSVTGVRKVKTCCPLKSGSEGRFFDGGGRQVC